MNVPPTFPPRSPRWAADPRSDVELVGAAQQGETAAAEVLLWRYRPLLKTLARHCYSAGHEPEDLLQWARLGLLEAIGQYRPELGYSVGRLIRCCARRRLKDVLNRERRQKRRVLNEALSLARLAEEEVGRGGATAYWAGEQSPVGPAARVLLAAVWGWARSHLSPLEYAVLRGSCESLSYQEMATALGVSQKGIDNAIQRLRRKLRRHWPEEFGRL